MPLSFDTENRPSRTSTTCNMQEPEYRYERVQTEYGVLQCSIPTDQVKNPLIAVHRVSSTYPHLASPQQLLASQNPVDPSAIVQRSSQSYQQRNLQHHIHHHPYYNSSSNSNSNHTTTDPYYSSPPHRSSSNSSSQSPSPRSNASPTMNSSHPDTGSLDGGNDDSDRRVKGPNMTEADQNALYTIVEQVLPSGTNQWEKVALLYNESQSRSRTAKQLRKHFDDTVKAASRKPNGSGIRPPRFIRVLTIRDAIRASIGVKSYGGFANYPTGLTAAAAGDKSVIVSQLPVNRDRNAPPSASVEQQDPPQESVEDISDDEGDVDDMAAQSIVPVNDPAALPLPSPPPPVRQRAPNVVNEATNKRQRIDVILADAVRKMDSTGDADKHMLAEMSDNTYNLISIMNAQMVANKMESQTQLAAMNSQSQTQLSSMQLLIATLHQQSQAQIAAMHQSTQSLIAAFMKPNSSNPVESSAQSMASTATNSNSVNLDI